MEQSAPFRRKKRHGGAILAGFTFKYFRNAIPATYEKPDESLEYYKS